MANRSESEILTETIDTYYNYRKAHQDARDSTEENMNFVLGDQWSAEDKASLDKANMPYLTKNILIPVIKKLTGIERKNRTDIVVVPSENGIDEIAWAMTRLNYHFANQGDVKLHYLLSNLFLLGLISDLGAYIMPYFTTEDNPLGTIKFKVISGLNILTDPMGRHPGLKDNKNVIYTTWWTKQDALTYFPDKRKDLEGLQKYQRGFLGLISKKAGRKTDLRDDRGTQKGGRYRVIEKYSLNRKRETKYYEPEEGKWYEIKDQKDFMKFMFYHPNAIKRTITKPELRVSITMSDNIVLFDGKSKLQNGEYPFKPFYPFFLDGDILGEIKNLKGYQTEHNKSSSSILHILNTQANSGWLARENSVDKDAIESGGSGTGKVIWWRGTKPEKILPGALPSGYAYMDEASKRGIYETSGLGENMMGRAETNRETGVLYGKRVSEGYSMLEMLFDNFSLTKEMLGKDLIWMYQHILPKEKIFQILREEKISENDLENYELAKEISENMNIGKYDVTTENVVSSATAKEREETMLYQLSKVTPPELVPWDEIWEASGTPRAKRIAERIREKLQPVDKASEQLGALSQQQPEIAQLLTGGKTQ